MGRNVRACKHSSDDSGVADEEEWEGMRKSLKMQVDVDYKGEKMCVV